MKKMKKTLALLIVYVVVVVVVVVSVVVSNLFHITKKKVCDNCDEKFKNSSLEKYTNTKTKKTMKWKEIKKKIKKNNKGNQSFDIKKEKKTLYEFVAVSLDNYHHHHYKQMSILNLF